MRIGILGGGQLAKMLIESSAKFGFEFVVFSLEKNSPAGMISKEFIGDWNNPNDLNIFANLCDVISLENEYIDYKNIEHIEKSGVKCYPDSSIVKLIQDKLVQKVTLKKLNVPVADFREIDSLEDLKDAAELFGYPFVLKTRTMGYDGKGNVEIKKSSQLKSAFENLSSRGKLFAEKFIDFVKEVAIQAVRNSNGDIKIYPLVETIQKNHICYLVLSSKNYLRKYKNRAEKIAHKILNAMNYVGVMGIEMFADTKDNLIVNELAPRVHNTGHYTIEAAKCSQFENHIRAILGLPLGSTEMICNSSAMINILGEKNEIVNNNQLLKDLKNVSREEDVYIHIYGKNKISKGRKMGHITLTGDNLIRLRNKAEKIRKLIKI
jgi:5-(carboxyamino)imidazole ribonucleotide synthase